MGKLRLREVRSLAKFPQFINAFPAQADHDYTSSHYPCQLQMRKLRLGGANGVAEGFSKSPCAPTFSTNEKTP
jgi:hypothetical protein